MKIPLKPDMKPMKQQPYRLNIRYKYNFKAKLERIMDAWIIEPIKESEWIIRMVFSVRFLSYKLPL